jgi:hypothetical protein
MFVGYVHLNICTWFSYQSFLGICTYSFGIGMRLSCINNNQNVVTILVCMNMNIEHLRITYGLVYVRG